MFRKFLAFTAAAIVLPGGAGAQYIGGNPPPPPVAPMAGQYESPEARLAREVRLLAINPRSFQALVGAGRASLDVGDGQAALGFYGRAEEVYPTSPVPKIGMGASLAAIGQPAQALPYFTRAQQLGAAVVSFALDRGECYDLLGQQPAAQNDYRIALGGTDPDEARRRLGLSLGISGRREEALSALAPLLARRDPGALRARAFVLALTGDSAGAVAAVNSAMPGMAGSLAPFMSRLPSLTPAAKAAAVLLGDFEAGGASVASNVPAYQPPAYQPQTYRPPAYQPPANQRPSSRPPAGTTQVDRLAEIDSWLSASAGTPRPEAPATVASPPAAAPPQQQVASSTPVVPPAQSAPALSPPVAAQVQRRLWIQLASGSNEQALGAEFARIARQDPDLFKGISPWVSTEGERSRLLIGPFRNREDQETFTEQLDASRIPGFGWTNDQGQMVRKLGQ